MALKRASVKLAADRGARDENGEILDVPEWGDDHPLYVPRHKGNGRPKIRKLMPDGSDSNEEFEYYARASSYGKIIESTFLLERWKLRNAVWGAARRDDLVLRAAAVQTAAETPQDGAELDEVVKACLDAAGTGRRATIGTAIHKLTEQADEGRDLRHLPGEVLTAIAKYREMMDCFTVVSSEQFVVCDALQAAGTYDRLLSPRWTWPVVIDGKVVRVLEPGDVIIDDTKTGKSDKYFGPAYSVQQLIYNLGVPYNHRDGRQAWADGARPVPGLALLMHLPFEHPEDAGVQFVDLDVSWELAQLCQQVEEARKREDLFWPSALPRPAKELSQATETLPPLDPEQEESQEYTLVDAIECADTVDEIDRLWEQWGQTDEWSDEATAAVRARLAQLQVSA